MPSFDALLEFVLTATSHDAAASAVLPSEVHAANLWTFIQLKGRRFTSADALDVVRELGDFGHLNPKVLAKQLQQALSQRRVSLKHTNALQLAARLLGHSSYHSPTVAAASAAPLRFMCALGRMDQEVKDWKAGVQLFSSFIDGVLEEGGQQTFQLGFTPTAVTMDTPRTTARDEHGRSVPQLQLQWSAHSPQLASAIASVEALRRRYEEGGRVIVDGLAAAQFCLRNPHPDAHPHDPANSELVVLDVSPGPGFRDEMARGDEVKCWAELDFLHPQEKSPVYSLDGATWLVDGQRYEWQLSTVRMEGVAPRIVTRALTQTESAKLFRRHRNALHSRHYFDDEDRVKTLPSFSTAGEMVELDKEQLRKYMPKELARALRVQSRVSVDTLIKLAQVTKIADPSVLIRKPKRAELVLLRDDELLRTFVSRVGDVVFEAPRRLSDQVIAEVEDAVEKMLVQLKWDIVTADGAVHSSLPRKPPYMVYANQGKEMLERFAKLGLVAYAGVFTTVMPIRERDVREQRIGTNASLKVERVLFLDVDVQEAVGLDVSG